MNEHEAPCQRARRMLGDATPCPVDAVSSALVIRDITAAENEIGRLLAERVELRNGYNALAGAFGLFPGASPAEVTTRLQEAAERLTAAEARVATLKAAVERVRPVVEALAVAYDTEAGFPGDRSHWMARLMNALERRFTTYAADAAWLRSLLAPQPQDGR